MANTIKSSVYNVKISQKNVFLRDFTSILQELASKLDNIDPNDTRVLDKNKNNIETSIWFDSFDNITDFSKNNIFDDTVCFLLAKDMNFQFIEDKEDKSIRKSTPTNKQKPKIPAHCVYIKSQDILIMEETTNSPSISTLLRGITSKLVTLKKEDIYFKPKVRENVIERLMQFVDNIKSIELIDINMEKYLTQNEDDGYLHNILHNPETILNAKLYINSDDWRTKVVNFFSKTLSNRATKELENIRISFKDDKQNDDIVALYDNLVYLKIEKNIYFEDISILENLKRIEYSQSIYQTMIEAYNEQKNNF